MNLTDEQLKDLELTRKEFNHTVQQLVKKNISVEGWIEKRKVFLALSPADRDKRMGEVREKIDSQLGYNIEEEVKIALYDIKNSDIDSDEFLEKLAPFRKLLADEIKKCEDEIKELEET